MNITHRIITATAALAAALVALPSIAGLRQWEPSDYIQDNLVLHYDGIRNAGADAAHDSGATVWKDLSPSGNDASTYVHSSASNNGKWGDNGFVFATDSYWKADGRTSLSGDFTLQVACDTTTSDMQNTKNWPNLVGNNGAGNSGNNDELTIFYHKNNKQLSAKVLNAYVGGSSTTSGYRLGDWNLRYATLVRQGSTANFFDGIAPVKTGTSIATTAIGADILIGSGTTDKNDGGSGDRRFTGTIYSVRIYAKSLSNDELAWNRALDEARFHSAASVPESAICASAVPDAVVASAVAGANGAEPAGCYMVDDGGHVFRAAPCAVVSGTSYACTGCTVATWDATLGAYGAAETRDGVYAVAVAPGDKVRIEWQWAAASGSIAANPYVADGLVLYYDGEWNAGFGAHDSAATIWKDLSATGNDAEFVYLAPGGGWLDNAYDFQTNGHFQTTSAIDLGSSFSVQMATDSRSNPFVGNLWPWFVGSNDGHFQFYPNNSTLNVVLNADGMLGSGHRSQFTWSDSRFLTAMVDANSNILFQTSMSERNWSVGSGPTPLGSQVFAIGGPTKALYPNDSDRTKRSARTPFHAVRIYTKILSADEIARNRAVDEARFFGNGTPATGAVIVQTSIAGLSGREPDGIYFPDAWTFAAGSGTQTVRGIEWQCSGYQLQTWDAATSTWGAQVSNESCSYSSPSGTSFASVRLTWLWEPVSGVRTAADYALADYATGAIELHLDGMEHGSSATVWSDLSGHGRDATLGGNGDHTSGWTADGYFFASNAVFATADSSVAKFALGKRTTIQILADATAEANDAGNHHGTFVAPYIGGNRLAWGSVWYKSDGYHNVFYHTDSLNGSAWNTRASESSVGGIKYLTALRDDSKTALISGTAYPAPSEERTDNGGSPGWFNGSKSDVAAAGQWCVGSTTLGGGGDPLYGTVKSVRLYDRLLGEDELAWNRSVDSARFFGALAATNVVVVANEFSGLATDTAYEVFGAHTFAASPSSVDGSSANFVRVQTLQANGTWVETARSEGGSYDYTPAAGTVRIEFRKSNPFVIVVR